MKIFDEAPVDVPPIQVTPLDEDEQGVELLERLDRLQREKSEADGEAESAGQALPDLMARADDLAARAMAGEADEEEASRAESELRERQAKVEAARRRSRQCQKAVSLVKERIQDRAEALHEENTEAVRDTHQSLVDAAYQAQRRAATLLRILREFEMRYARYTSGDAPEPHPRYLAEEERTSPPRNLMGPARSPSGHVFASSEATQWMQSAAALLGKEGPPIVDVTELDFESEEATFAPATTLDSDVDISPGTHPAGTSPGPAERSEPHSTGESDTPHHDAEQRAGGTEADSTGEAAKDDVSEDDVDPARRSHEAAVSPPDEAVDAGAAEQGDAGSEGSDPDGGDTHDPREEAHEEADPDSP